MFAPGDLACLLLGVSNAARRAVGWGGEKKRNGASAPLRSVLLHGAVWCHALEM